MAVNVRTAPSPVPQSVQGRPTTRAFLATVRKYTGCAVLFNPLPLPPPGTARLNDARAVGSVALRPGERAAAQKKGRPAPSRRAVRQSRGDEGGDVHDPGAGRVRARSARPGA